MNADSQATGQMSPIAAGSGPIRKRWRRPSLRLPCRDGIRSGMKQDAGTPPSGPEVSLGNVRLGRMAALRQTATTRRRSSDRHGHHRDAGTDPAQNAAATKRKKGQESTTGVSLRPPVNTAPQRGQQRLSTVADRHIGGRPSLPCSSMPSAAGSDIEDGLVEVLTAHRAEKRCVSE
jgi:hypothetical protein